MDLTSVTGPLKDFGPEEKLLLICNKGKRAYLLQNRLKAFGYQHVKVLEGGNLFTDISWTNPKLKTRNQDRKKRRKYFMACTISAAEIKRVKALGFLNNKGTDLFNARVITVNGKITAQQTAVLAQAAEKFGSGEVEFTTRLTVEIRGVHFDDIPPSRIHRSGWPHDWRHWLPWSVRWSPAKGTTCQYGLYDTFALSEKIHQQFYLGYHSVKLPLQIQNRLRRLPQQLC